MKTSKILWGVAVVALVIATIGLFTPVVSTVRGIVGGTTNYDAIDVTDGYYVDGVLVIDSGGILTSNIGLLRSYTYASSSVVTSTLKQSDMMYDTILATPGSTAATQTITFPATSTLTTFIPTAGDRADQCWFNSSTTAAATFTFAAGTGIDLEVATSTVQTGAFDLVLGADNMGCFTFLRKTNTDIVAGFLEYSNAD